MTRKLLLIVIAAVLVAGTALRLFPAFAGQPWLSEFFMTEDGYLMLTVARNMAIGLSMSVSEGTIPTNGVQPMATFLFALPYWLTGGDKVASLTGITLISAAWSVAGAFAVRAYARLALPQDMRAPVWSWLVAALWFIGPLLLRHTMNALETGLYTLFVLLALIWFTRILRLGLHAGRAETLGFGAFCGLVFLARNDGAFLVTAIFLSWSAYELFILRRGVIASALRLIPAGIASLIIAAPWLLHNQINFGSIMPISGSAQIVGSTFAQNLALIPVKLFEYAFPMLPIPDALEANALVIGICIVAVVVICALYLLDALRLERPVRFMLLAYALFGLMLAGYYGLFFGAAHFVSRYLSPTAPFLIVATVAVAYRLARLALGARALPAVAIAGIGALVLSAGLLARQLPPGAYQQGHFQVVRWIETNVPPEDWVGAVQTGTLGYWHDRTVNLDGKVNPEALAELHAKGHVLDYIIDSRIDHIADWHGVSDWVSRSESDFGSHFEVVVADRAANLGALRRKAH